MKINKFRYLIGKRKLHIIKLQSELWCDVFTTELKTWEYRKNDRDYQLGDYIKFKLIDTDGKIEYTKQMFYISYIMYGGNFGIPKDYCIFSIRKC